MAIPKIIDHTSLDFYPDAKKRAVSQKIQMLHLLRSAGAKGVTSDVLADIGLSYHSRISELYAEGYVIAVENIGGGLARYVLVSEPRSKMPKPKKAQDVVLEQVEKLGTVNAERLRAILEANDMFIVRKTGSVKPVINIASR